MTTSDLPAPERDALLALTNANAAHPEAAFEHDGTAVRMPNADEDVKLSISREILRRLGHRGRIRFTHQANAYGGLRWTFEVVPDTAKVR